jgi:hypothetical protein
MMRLLWRGAGEAGRRLKFTRGILAELDLKIKINYVL